MKKLLILAVSSLLVLGLAGCSKESSVVDPTTTDDTSATQDTSGRLYNGFTLATSYNPEFSAYANWHSDNVIPFGEGSSGNTARFVNEKNDELIDIMRYANPATEEGKAEFQEAYLEWVKLMNEEMPLIPLYANDYHDLYNAEVQNFVTNPLWQWPDSIVEATGVDTFVAGNTTFDGEFITGWKNSAYDNNIRKLIYGGTGLFTVNADGEIVPNYMVEDVTSSDDMLTWTFKLKPGVKFSDGEELTADDVAFTYYMYAHPSFTTAGGSAAYYPDTIVGAEDYTASCEAGACDTGAFTGIEVVDPYTITFNLTDATSTVRSDNFSTYILAEHQLAPDGVIDVEAIKANYMTSPLGTGPYKIDEFRIGEYAKLSINPYYEGNINGIKPTIETVIVKVVPNETDIDQLLSGEVDLLAGMVQEDKIDAAKAASNITYNNYPRHGFGHITWHNDFGILQDTAVRQALAYGLDRQAFIADFLGAYGTVVEGPYSTVFWMIDDAWVDGNLTKYTYDPAKVAEILEADGWTKGSDGIYAKDGQKMIVNVANGSADWADSLNLVTANSVAETGIQWNFYPIDFAVLLDHYYGSYKG